MIIKRLQIGRHHQDVGILPFFTKKFHRNWSSISRLTSTSIYASCKSAQETAYIPVQWVDCKQLTPTSHESDVRKKWTPNTRSKPYPGRHVQARPALPPPPAAGRRWPWAAWAAGRPSARPRLAPPSPREPSLHNNTQTAWDTGKSEYRPSASHTSIALWTVPTQQQANSMIYSEMRIQCFVIDDRVKLSIRDEND